MMSRFMHRQEQEQREDSRALDEADLGLPGEEPDPGEDGTVTDLAGLWQ
jgi:hypothetical protein